MCARRILRVGPGVEIVRGPVNKARDARQRKLRFDAMPDRIKPCLALLGSKPPAGDGYDWTNRQVMFWISGRIAPSSTVRPSCSTNNAVLPTSAPCSKLSVAGAASDLPPERSCRLSICSISMVTIFVRWRVRSGARCSPAS